MIGTYEHLQSNAAFQVDVSKQIIPDSYMAFDVSLLLSRLKDQSTSDGRDLQYGTCLALVILLP